MFHVSIVKIFYKIICSNKKEITKLNILQNKRFSTSNFMTTVMIINRFNAEDLQILIESQHSKKNIVVSYNEVEIYIIPNATICHRS